MIQCKYNENIQQAFKAYTQCAHLHANKQNVNSGRI